MKKIISLLLCALLIFPSVSLFFPVAGAKCAPDCPNVPSIVIPGLFQSELTCYDENGEPMLDSNGEVRKGPFFMDTDEVVKDAISSALLPLVKTLATQDDKNHEFANALSDVLGRALMERIKSDSNGNMVYDVRAAQYNTSVANLSEHDRTYALNAIPLNDYVEKVGAEHLYFFSYSSFDNIERLANQLTELIETAKRETGHDKVNIVPISQGGSIFNAVMEYHPGVAESLNRVVYIVPAADGSNLLGDIYAYGLNDSDEALYDYMFPMLLSKDSEWLGYLINFLIRIFPKDVLNDVLDIAVDRLISDYLSNSTCLWGLIPSASYPIAREKYLLSDDKAVIRAQTDRFYHAQLNAKKNILALREKGVEVFDIVGFNKALYPIACSWDKVNADGIIQLESSSLGAISAPVGSTLGEGYVQKGNAYGTCSDPTHNHIDPKGIVDASAGLLPDHTFYFCNQDHEQTGGSDVVIRLATRLLWDKSFKDVYSYPQEFPQFNNFRYTKWLEKNLKTAKAFNVSTLSPEDAKELEAAVAEVEAQLEQTVVDADAFAAAEARFNAIFLKISTSSQPESEKKKETFRTGLAELVTILFRFFAKIFNGLFGMKGFAG